jgi:uncharacterized protein
MSKPLDTFWSYLADGEWRLPRCPACRTWTWPGAYSCPRDGGSLEWEPAPREGVIFTYTVVHRSFLGPDVPTPYAVALVALDGVPDVRLLGSVSGEAATLSVGARVRFELRKLTTHTLPVVEVISDATAR